MIRDENDRESPEEPTEGGSDHKSTQDDKNGDWITELEQELKEISEKWFGS